MNNMFNQVSFINDEAKVVVLTGAPVGDMETAAQNYITDRSFSDSGEQIGLKTEEDRVFMVMPRFGDADVVAQGVAGKNEGIDCEITNGKAVKGESLFDHLYAGEAPETSPELGAPV